MLWRRVERELERGRRGLEAIVAERVGGKAFALRQKADARAELATDGAGCVPAFGASADPVLFVAQAI
jgi:hypothetical protein